MKKCTFASFLSLALVLMLILGACGSNDKKSKTDHKGKNGFTVAMVTDTNGVDDRAFNQSAWEGLKRFGKKNNMTKGKEGFNYLQSASEADYKTNLNTAVRGGYDLIFGNGFTLKEAVEAVAKQNPKQQFALIDDKIEDLDNVVSVGFKDHHGAYLAGVAAGLTTKSNKVGFIGGVKGSVIGRFEAGFKAGVKAVNPEAIIAIQYANDFAKADKGQQIASSMYSNGVDIIFHAAGGTGNGVFSEAKNLKKKAPDRMIWVIGVDRDQWAEGKITGNDGKEHNVTLTSVIKHIDVAVEEISKRTKEGNFPGGENIKYGLEKGAVGLITKRSALSKEVLKKVNEYKQKIINEEIKVPEKP